MLTNDLYPYLNANSEIVYRIAQELSRKNNCEISILGYNRVGSHSFPNPPFRIRTIRMKTVTDYNRIILTTHCAILRMLKFLIRPKCLRYHLRRKAGDRCCLVKEYQSHILRELRKRKIDCIIGFTEPTDTLRALSGLNLQIPYISYKLDPWSTNYRVIDKLQARFAEETTDARASRIIVTEAIRRDYENCAIAGVFDKIETMEFPNIIKYSNIGFGGFEKGKIHCVFAGTLYARIRNPEYAVKLFKQFNSNSVVFHIIGPQYEGSCLADPLPSNIIYHGAVSSDKAMAYMQSADVLVNIGNTVLNQMPSKILTYISLGKPIINIVKSPMCPTLPYLEKYPLALNVLETSAVQYNDVERVRDFIIAKHKDALSFEVIEKLYNTCTPKYVGNRLYEIICEVVGNI